MEINVHNAFFINMIKLSINPFLSSLKVASVKIEELAYQQALNVLETPLLSTLLCSYVLIFLISAITLSMIITGGLLCMTAVIIIFEGFVLGMIFSLAIAITIITFMVVIIMVGVISSYKKWD